jgi:hypothetical protein
MRNIAKNRKQTQFVPASNPFIQAMTNAGNVAFTENGALTNKSTKSDILDWFGAGGALRQRQPQDIINLFTRAFAEDRLTALKILFYFRDREGQGERNTFRILANYLGQNYADVVRKNLENIPFYGRFDDLYCLVGTPLENDVFTFIAKQLKADLHAMKDGKPASLAAKWLKSENTSSAESRRLGRKTREALELTPKRYRKILASLRSYINVLETKMCAGKWSEINFEQVPSKASLNYRKAFGRHDQTRYAAYLESVKKGEAKMNASAIFPYEIFRSLVKDPHGYGSKPSAQEILQADLQWKSMPEWLDGKDFKAITIADCSGSMFSGIPNIWVAVSLAIYFAERNVGPFKDIWMNFSDTPTFQTLKGSNLYEKYQNMDKANWGGSTNLMSAMRLILNTAVKNKVSQKSMPTMIFVISDMEFNIASSCNDTTNFQSIRKEYETAGYQPVQIVWWNVASRNDNFPIRADDTGTCLVSGCSPSIFKSLMSGKKFDPLSMVYDTVNVERYNRVVV